MNGARLIVGTTLLLAGALLAPARVAAAPGRSGELDRGPRPAGFARLPATGTDVIAALPAPLRAVGARSPGSARRCPDPVAAQRLEYVATLEIDEPSIDAPGEAFGAEDTDPGPSAQVNVGALIAFAADITGQAREDVQNSFEFAQRASKVQHDPNTDPIGYYEAVVDSLEKLGWFGQEVTLTTFHSSSSSFKADESVFDIIEALLTDADEVELVKKAVDGLKDSADDSNQVTLFNRQTHDLHRGGFMVGLATETNGLVAVSLGAFTFNTTDMVTRVLWFDFNAANTSFQDGSTVLSLDDGNYASVREAVQQRLNASSGRYVANTPLGN